jgi:hypothetical protein
MTLTKEQIPGDPSPPEPFLLIDEVLDYEPGKRPKAIKRVSKTSRIQRPLSGLSGDAGCAHLEAYGPGRRGPWRFSVPENRGKLALYGRH